MGGLQSQRNRESEKISRPSAAIELLPQGALTPLKNRSPLSSAKS